jgi:hypothetical protein
MLYQDLIQFESLETVVQLRTADRKEEARRLVRTYVISDDMADRLNGIIIPQLQFALPADNKGIFIVGNYGTGKSHLMSVISAVAEHAEFAQDLSHPKVVAAAGVIAGKFKVIRDEIGASTMSLRDILVQLLTRELSKMGVAYTFPPASQVINNKTAFEDMMAAFNEKYPDMGLLVVIDEMLEYLRFRHQQELIFDLSILRELGEVCRDSRLRFIGGIQEMLFENPRFQFASDSLRRVKDRFEQVLIARRDMKFVVAERLLKKNAAQQQKVREQLLPFARFYGNMNERMDEFVRLFPVHPDYIDTLERIGAIENREVLKTISIQMRQLLDQKLPTDRPGLFSYQDYWLRILQEPSFRTLPDVKEVVECSQVLEARVQNAFTRPTYKPMALDIIRGLSVHRLTTGDIYAKLGATADELRDSLCLYLPLVAEMGGNPDEDLRGLVETVLEEIKKTVSGQFISSNPNNGQFYLDLKKSVDYDALIEKRAEILDDSILDRYYFQTLTQLLDYNSVTTAAPGYNVWQYELEWQQRRVTRQGYLFFGSPNERSTAQPPRDFYLYFLAYFEPTKFRDEKKADELFFKLNRTDENFQKALERYAAAKELANTSSGDAQRTYNDRASGYLQTVVRWLNENLTEAFTITYEGKSRKLREWVVGKINTSRFGSREIINTVGSVCLATHFEDLAKDYPTFSVLITNANRTEAAQAALRWLRGSAKTQLGKAVMEALQLIEGDRLDVSHSQYVRYILDRLQQKGSGQVVNRSEIIERIYTDVEYMAPNSYRLEPEWVAVLLATLVYNGDIVLSLPNADLDASKLDTLLATSVADLANFKNIKRPKDWDLAALRALFELLGMSPGQAQLLTQGQNHDVTIQEMQTRTNELVRRVVKAQLKLHSGYPVWNRKLVEGTDFNRYRISLDALKAFLESLQAYSTAGKLKNFRYDETAVKNQQPNLVNLKELEELDGLVNELLPIASYLLQAETFLTPAHPLVTELRQTRQSILFDLENDVRRQSASFRSQALKKLNEIKTKYIKAYIELHTRSRLNVNEATRRSKLRQDNRIKTLEQLSHISLMPAHQLKAYRAELDGLIECNSLIAHELDAVPLCPHCTFQPVTQTTGSPVNELLNQLDERLDRMLQEWTKSLQESLQEEGVQRDFDLLSGSRRPLVEKFSQSGHLPEDLNGAFVEDVKQVLSGLQRVLLRTDKLVNSLQQGGSPVTRDELERRFRSYLDDLLKHNTVSKVRIVIDTGESREEIS